MLSFSEIRKNIESKNREDKEDAKFKNVLNSVSESYLIDKSLFLKNIKNTKG